MTLGEWLREQFLFAGAAGAVGADLHRDYVDSTRGQFTRMPSKLTYASFMRSLGLLSQLGWVERTGRTEPARQRGVPTSGVLRDRVFYRLTKAGRDANPGEWRYLHRRVYPSRYSYSPTGRSVGRPTGPRRVLDAPVPPAPRPFA